MNVLFVCSKNQWRSPTAESLFRREPGLDVRSKGVSRSARRTVTAADIEWADLVLVMETKHKRRLASDHPDAMKRATTHVLGIPDEYEFMDPQLIEVLEASVRPLLDDRPNAS